VIFPWAQTNPNLKQTSNASELSVATIIPSRSAKRSSKYWACAPNWDVDCPKRPSQSATFKVPFVVYFMMLLLPQTKYRWGDDCWWTGKKIGRKPPWSNLHVPTFSWHWVIYEKSSRNNLCPGRDSNMVPLEYARLYCCKSHLNRTVMQQSITLATSVPAQKTVPVILKNRHSYWPRRIHYLRSWTVPLPGNTILATFIPS
jgi:hypothetical protein